MSAPDHRPYLRPGADLCTAEDVLAWLESLTLTRAPEAPAVYSSFWVLADACDDLAGRLARG